MAEAWCLTSSFRALEGNAGCGVASEECARRAPGRSFKHTARRQRPRLAPAHQSARAAIGDIDAMNKPFNPHPGHPSKGAGLGVAATRGMTSA